MSKIKPLSPEVVAKIAAGEVVERPASVVKELLENALDAGSRSVRVEIQGGGRKLIRVTDDGEGMTPDEARLALQRHTTSKIESVEDLFALHTFGFRGEALASIAAVSRMKLSTRKAGDLSGVELEVEGGAVLVSREAGIPPGTSIEVRDLFFNVPARLKFLKSPGTEMAHIGEVLAKTALANPRVRFQLFHEGRQSSLYPLRQDPSARLAEALGDDVAGKMFPFHGRQGELKIEGFGGQPDLHRSNGRGIYLFVNRRPVRDRLLTHAVLEGYRNLIPSNRYPTAVLFVDVLPTEVDVNVHPSKWEVKFSDSETVHRSVIRAIRAMLEETPWLKDSPEKAAGLKEIHAVYRPSEGKVSFPVSWTDSFHPDPVRESREGSPEGAAGVSFLGQIQNTYLLFASPEGLLLLDQHAAHERILLEKLEGDLSGGRLSRQGLLLPEVIDLPPAESGIIEEHLDDLAKMGFELVPAGGRTFWLKSVPQILSAEDPRSILEEMIREISSWQKGADLGKILDSLLHRMACRGAIPAGRPMGTQKALALFSDLQQCRFPSHCPHGRPAVLRITHSDLEKMFGRK